MKKELKEKLEKARKLSFSLKTKKKKKKKKSSKVTPVEFKKKGSPMKVEDLDDVLSGLMNVKP